MDFQPASWPWAHCIGDQNAVISSVQDKANCPWLLQVSNKGDLFNMYTDTNGAQQSMLLGNVADLRTVKVKEIGGIPIEKLQAHYEVQRDWQGRKDSGMPSSIVGFPDDRQLPLPPDTVKVYTVRTLLLCLVACCGKLQCNSATVFTSCCMAEVTDKRTLCAACILCELLDLHVMARGCSCSTICVVGI